MSPSYLVVLRDLQAAYDKAACCRAQVGSTSPTAPEGAERSEAPGRDRARRHNVTASAAGAALGKWNLSQCEHEP